MQAPDLFILLVREMSCNMRREVITTYVHTYVLLLLSLAAAVFCYDAIIIYMPCLAKTWWDSGERSINHVSQSLLLHPPCRTTRTFRFVCCLFFSRETSESGEDGSQLTIDFLTRNFFAQLKIMLVFPSLNSGWLISYLLHFISLRLSSFFFLLPRRPPRLGPCLFLPWPYVSTCDDPTGEAPSRAGKAESCSRADPTVPGEV